MYMHTTISDSSRGGGALAAMTPEREWQARVQALFRTTVSTPGFVTLLAALVCWLTNVQCIVLGSARWVHRDVLGCCTTACCGSCAHSCLSIVRYATGGSGAEVQQPRPGGGFPALRQPGPGPRRGHQLHQCERPQSPQTGSQTAAEWCTMPSQWCCMMPMRQLLRSVGCPSHPDAIVLLLF